MGACRYVRLSANPRGIERTMKQKQWIYTSIMLALEFFFLGMLYYLYDVVLPNVSRRAVISILYCMMLQCIAAAVVLFLFYLLWIAEHRNKKVKSVLSSFTIIESGKKKAELIIQNQSSFFVVKNKKGEVIISSTDNIDKTWMECGVFNLVSGNWYLEALSPRCPIGLKREEGGIVYRLKEQIPYQLRRDDIIYIHTTKIVLK